MRGFGGGTLFGALLVLSMPYSSLAQEIETVGGHCNDEPFDSDGAGITGCFYGAIRYNDFFAGIGTFAVTPELKNTRHFRNDPLEEKGRLTGWIGKIGEWNGYEYAYAGRVGLEGGVADDIGFDMREFFHELFGLGVHDLVSQNDTKFLAGVSGWMRTELDRIDAGTWDLRLLPYAHAAVGLDTVEAGAGFMFALQPDGESTNLALLLPKNGAYAPVFGGDGIGLFGGVRGIAYEGLYEELANPFIAEAGIVAQTTLWDFWRVGAAASCTTEPYEAAGKPDCQLSFQMGGLF